MNKLLYFCIMLIGIGCSTDRASNSELVNTTLLSSPAASPAGEPFLFTDAQDQVYLSWIENQDTVNYFKFSKLINDQWTTPTTIASGSSWFVNWADYPMIAVNGNNYLAHYLTRSGTGTYAYDVTLVSSANGKEWSNPFLLNTDNKEAEHGFVTILPYGDNFFVTWLDGRNTVMEEMEGDHHDGHHGAMSLRAAVIDANGNRLNEWELDNKTCDCCQTTAAITSNGPVVVYRDRSDEEIRDMSIVRLINNEWTKPQPIHADQWKIAGCPVNGPRISNYENTLAVAWFTAASDSAHVNVSFSSDGGASFSKPVRIDEGKTNGRVDIAMLGSDRAMVSWMEGSKIKARIVNKDGTMETPIEVANSSDARSSGFPQMTKAGEKLIFAWTNDENKNIKVSSLSISKL
ncbi:MAG: exo-alpha-sialidase [Cyclobacteriaceae bacterium]|jgi:hypothetical protein|nr:exo-alpha-sialidase [Cyclobacteriaceae bacterium]